MTNDQEEPLFICESCGKNIMDGDPYHRGVDVELCTECAPSWAEMIANPWDFKTTDGGAVNFKDILRDYNLHLARGGKPEDKMVRP